METKPSWRDRLRGILGGQPSREQRPELREIEASGLFDRTWYLANTPGAAASGLDPVEHYATCGWQAGFSPGPQFDSAWYRLRYNDIAASGMDPLLHFIRTGRHEGRSPRATAADILDEFQSLGVNCEFGFAQRHFGCRVLSLFGFATTTPQAMLALLEANVPFLGTPDCLRVSVSGDDEYMIDIEPYGFRFHTDMGPATLDADQVRDHEFKRLRFLWRKLQEDLEEGGRIFVLKAGRALLREHGARLALALRRQSDNHLLWVSGAAAATPPGSVSVESLGNGLMWARVGRCGPPGLLASFEAWHEVCRQAHALRSRDGTLARSPRPEGTPSGVHGGGS